MIEGRKSKMSKVIIYTKSECPFCIHAKNLLLEKNIPFEERFLNSPEEMAELKDKTGFMTFPQIFINDKLIGGFEDLKEIDEKGELEDLSSPQSI